MRSDDDTDNHQIEKIILCSACSQYHMLLISFQPVNVASLVPIKNNAFNTWLFFSCPIKPENNQQILDIILDNANNASVKGIYELGKKLNKKDNKVEIIG